MRKLYIIRNDYQRQPWRWHIKAGGRITTGCTENYTNRRDMIKTMSNDLFGSLSEDGREFVQGGRRIPVVYVNLTNSAGA